jgi:hypothetical protein
MHRSRNNKNTIMKRLLFAAAIAIAAAVTTQEASAQSYQQRQRINQGVRSGQLTRQEARNLRAREAQYRQAERAAWADGRVTPRERAYLANLKRSNSRAIYYNRHDRQQRW